MNPRDSKHLARLIRSVETSRWKLEPFRRERTSAIRQYVGFHYSEDGAPDRVPINLLELMINIYMRQLVAKRPQVMVESRDRKNRPSALQFELAMNHLLEKQIDFDKSLKVVALDAMFGMGIMKVGVTNQALDEVDGYLHDAGLVYADPVHVDDWVHDLGVKRFEQCGYMGHRYRIPVEVAKEAFSKKSDKIVAAPPSPYNEQGDERTETIARGTETHFDEFEDTVELWDLWLPAEGLVITVPAESVGSQGSGGQAELYDVTEWDGPERGPFHRLAFNQVPSNTMPLSPSGLMIDLHDLANSMFRKLGRQAERQKNVLAYQGGEENDAENVKESSDGEYLRVDNPKSMETLSLGGIDQTSLAFLLQVKDMFAYHGGNLDALGGLSPQAETLGQDEILASNASQRLSDMQDTMISFTNGVVEAIGYELWTDPLMEMDLIHRISDDFQIPFTYTPEMRSGEYYDYAVSIETYSMQHNTPGKRLQTLTQVMNQYVGPLMPLMQAQGMTINFKELFKVVGTYANLPELEDILQFVGADSFAQGAGGAAGGGGPANTSHTSTRVNRPGATREGKDDVMSRVLMGAGVQDSEAAAIGRPTG